LVGALVGHLIQTDATQEPKRFVDIGLGKFSHEALPEADIAQSSAQHVLHYRKPLHQRVFLKNHSHAPARPRQLVAAQRGNFDIVERDRAACRLHQPIDTTDHS
jgi:hypothetical protein